MAPLLAPFGPPSPVLSPLALVAALGVLLLLVGLGALVEFALDRCRERS